MAKRVFDLVASVLGLLLSSPALIVIAVLVVLDSRGPVFYRGIRVGRGGVPFRIVKFRTMVANAERLGPSSTRDDDPRITRIGRWLRRTKLDELPQLLNVLKGDMSLVGPRPQVPWAVELYSPEERRLLEVRPGITDYASIRFANEGELLRGSADPEREYLDKVAPEKLRLGLLYVSNQSFGLDLRLVAATLVKIGGGKAEWIVAIPGEGTPSTPAQGGRR